MNVALTALDNYYEQLPEPSKSCMLALRQIILQHATHFTEAWKYRTPFYCYKGKMCCYTWIHKKYKVPYIGFVAGKHLKSPYLLQEDRKLIKILLVQPTEDLPIDIIKQLLNDAIELYDKGIIKKPFE
jgi:hypothetical protein